MSSRLPLAPYPDSRSSSRRAASKGAYRMAIRAPCCLSFWPMLDPRPPVEMLGFAVYGFGSYVPTQAARHDC